MLRVEISGEPNREMNWLQTAANRCVVVQKQKNKRNARWFVHDDDDDAAYFTPALVGLT
jgi:hypothetical protein